MRRITIASATLLSAVLLAACGSAQELPEGATGAPLGSECDAQTFESTIHHILAESGMTIESMGEFTCSGDWAVVHANLKSEEPPSAVADLFVFERSEGDWILKAPETVCGTIVTEGTRPADAMVPEDIWADACTTLAVTN